MQESPFFIGIEIGGTKLQLVKANAANEIVQTQRFTVDTASGAEGIQAQLAAALPAMATADVAAIGAGFGGPVDWTTGCIRTSHQIGGWADLNLAAWLRQITGKPAIVDNDANTAALAEAVHGSGKNHPTVFYMTIGSGIGGGIITNGKIYHGQQPGEVEVGHLRLDKSGQTLEEACSGWAVNKKVCAAVVDHPNSFLASLARHQPAGHEAKLLKTALENSDPVATAILQETADDLAFALSHVVHLFHPDVLILGGGLSLLKEHLRRPVEEKLARYVMKAFLPPPAVAIAALEEQAVPVGAIELAKQYLQQQASTFFRYEAMD